MQPFLQLTNIKLNYHNNEGELPALNDINFSLKKNEFVAIVGPSGCGKTTILSIISGILKQSGGKVTLEGEEITTTTRKIGYMFQKDQLFGWRTIKQNVNLGLEICKDKSPESKKFVDELLTKYGLADFMNKHPHELSGGMRQRVALIRTLATKPKLLLLDEPFGALDYQTRQKVIDDVSSIIRNEKITSILVTHDISEAICMTDRIIVLSNRPATVRKIINVDLDKSLPPSKRKNAKEFTELLNYVWKELDSG